VRQRFLLRPGAPSAFETRAVPKGGSAEDFGGYAGSIVICLVPGTHLASRFFNALLNPAIANC
jgi:hypothetical protein